MSVRREEYHSASCYSIHLLPSIHSEMSMLFHPPIPPRPLCTPTPKKLFMAFPNEPDVIFLLLET